MPIARTNPWRRERDPDLVLAGCWAHGRRGFKEPSRKQSGGLVVKQIGLMYAVEKKLREQTRVPGCARRCEGGRAGRA